ncbi:Uncharacterized protein Fot_33124 [Forsythia ovata]|uniref:Uncharacterized protein n=1 Tax=Forsythia ovata TaxID=205694 RepID=A0ABD1T9S7_9LAMI
MGQPILYQNLVSSFAQKSLVSLSQSAVTGKGIIIRNFFPQIPSQHSTSAICFPKFPSPTLCPTEPNSTPEERPTPDLTLLLPFSLVPTLSHAHLSALTFTSSSTDGTQHHTDHKPTHVGQLPEERPMPDAMEHFCLKYQRMGIPFSRMEHFCSRKSILVQHQGSIFAPKNSFSSGFKSSLQENGFWAIIFGSNFSVQQEEYIKKM